MKNILFCLLLFYSGTIWGQRIYNGQVVDAESGEPIDNVSVYSFISGNLGKTDNAGNFRLEVMEKDSIQFNKVGYKETIISATNPNDSLIIIRLFPDTNSALTDVVVNTGYQSIPKERSTGSFVHIDNKLFNRSISPSIIDRLDGVTSSLLVDKAGTHTPFTIRGLGTLTSSHPEVYAPLIIIDNFPYEGDLNNINPNDVQSVTILRDAAASSIWGAKAGNGVIVITTKSGKYNQKTKFEINSNLTFKNKPDLYAVPQMNPSDYIDYEKFLFQNGYFDSDLSDNRTYPVLPPVVNILQQEKLGKISAAESTKMIDNLRSNDVRDGYLKYFYRNETLQQYDGSITGGSKKISFLASLGYSKSLQQLIGNKSNRITWRTKLKFTPTHNLTIELNTNRTWSENTANGIYPAKYADNLPVYPYASFYNPNGTPVYFERDYRANFKDTAGNGRLLNWQYSPLEDREMEDHTQYSSDLILNAKISYKILPALKAEIYYQHGQQNSELKDFYNKSSYYARNLINLYTNINNEAISYGIPIGGILDQKNIVHVSNNIRAQLDLDKTFSRRHNITAILGTELRETRMHSYKNRVYGYNDKNLTSIDVNILDRYPILDEISSDRKIPNISGSSSSLDRIISIYGNAGYNFDNRLNLSVSARKDATNILGVSTNNKWKPLWSTGGSWTISNEKFYKLRYVPYLKLRSTFGYSGNVNNSIPALTTLKFKTNRSITSNLPYAQIYNPPNPELRWEKIKMLNFGLDFGLIKNIINGSIDYYVKRSTDLIAPAPIDITLTGAETIWKNVASLDAHGWDIILNAEIMRGKLKWNSTLLFSYDNIKVGKYYIENKPQMYVGKGITITPFEGLTPYNIISYKLAGLNPSNGNPIGFVDGKKTEDYKDITQNAAWGDLVISGTSVPPYFGALRNTFSYSNISLSFNIAYRFGYYFRRSTIDYTSLNAGHGHPDFDRRWQKPGDERYTNIPSLIYPANRYRDMFFTSSTATVERGDNIRLKDIRLDYNLKLDKKWPRVVLYFYASDLGILWRKNEMGLDPDVYNTYPTPTSYSIGANINF